MTRITVDLDPDALAAARRALGTGSAAETVDAALREVVRPHRVAAAHPRTDEIDLARWRDDGGGQPGVMRAR